jgi:hypothetical protein
MEERNGPKFMVLASADIARENGFITSKQVSCEQSSRLADTTFKEHCPFLLCTFSTNF